MVCIHKDSGLQLIFASACASGVIVQFTHLFWKLKARQAIAAHLLQHSGITCILPVVQRYIMHSGALDVHAAWQLAHASALCMLCCLAVVCTGRNASSELKPDTTRYWAKTCLSCRQQWWHQPHEDWQCKCCLNSVLAESHSIVAMRQPVWTWISHTVKTCSTWFMHLGDQFGHSFLTASTIQVRRVLSAVFHF